MPREMRNLQTEGELTEYSRIYVNAFPAAAVSVENAAKRFQELVEKDDCSTLRGLFEGHELIAGMRLIDFSVNYFGQFIPAGGVGAVAVDMLNKKKGAARDLITFFLDHYEQKGAVLAMLYPFRPDFYYRMGFGYGPTIDQYSFGPSALPGSPLPEGIRYLTAEDAGLLDTFCAERAAVQHGFCRRSRWEIDGLLRGHGSNRTLVGIVQGGRLRGYLAYSFKRAHENNFVKNDLVIREWQWDGPSTLAGFCAFLNRQTDQFGRIVFATQEPGFHFLLSDVRHSSENMIPSVYHECLTSGVGLMYRIISVRKFFEATRFRDFNGQTLDLVLEVDDTFRPQNAGRYDIRFENGRASAGDTLPRGIRLGIDIADLSALLMGSVDFAALYRLGRARVEARDVPALSRLFFVAEKPQCISAF